MRKFGASLLVIGVVLLTTGCFSFMKKESVTDTAPEVQAQEPAPRVAEVAPPPEPDTSVCDELQSRAAQFELGRARQEGQIERLARHMNQLQARLDEAILEVVRTKAKLRGTESRAEAASEMAEAEIALMSLKATDAEAESGQAERLLEMSAAEFEKRNFGGALYLSSQAKSRIRAAQMRRVQTEATSRLPGEESFVEPLSMQVTERSNLRGGPGTGFDVLVTLNPGTPVQALSNKGLWVRVEGPDGVGGWIHETLIAER